MRLSDHPLSQSPWYLRPFFWNQRRKYGQVLQPALLWARVPPLFAAVVILYGVLDRRSSPLDPVLRSLVTVRVSQINWCWFCVDINSATLAQRTGSTPKLKRWATGETMTCLASQSGWPSNTQKRSPTPIARWMMPSRIASALNSVRMT